MAKYIFIFLALCVGLFFFAWICNFSNNAAQTTYEQYSASALLKKYEYFKDMSAKIDEKRANLNAYREELTELKANLSTEDRRINYEQRKSEALGLLAIYNSLVADYNSSMSKFNYAFCNRGDLPASNLEPLPRDHKPYVLSLTK